MKQNARPAAAAEITEIVGPLDDAVLVGAWRRARFSSLGIHSWAEQKPRPRCQGRRRLAPTAPPQRGARLTFLPVQVVSVVLAHHPGTCPRWRLKCAR